LAAFASFIKLLTYEEQKMFEKHIIVVLPWKNVEAVGA
jgi:hypothetical protein